MAKLKTIGPGMAHTYPLNGELVTFGRSADCSLVLDAEGVSRCHGRFVHNPDGMWSIEDLGSKNGVLVGGQAITARCLRDGDVVAIGSLLLRFCDDSTAEVATHGVTISREVIPNNATRERAAGETVGIDRRRLASLYRISQQLISRQGTAEILETAASIMVAEFEAGVVVFGLTRDPHREPDKIMVRPTDRPRGEVRLSSQILQRCMDARTAILIEDTSTDVQLNVAISIVTGQIQSAICVPLLSKDAVTGFVYLDSRHGRGRPYDESDLEFASAIAALLGTIVENARLQEADLIKQGLEAELGAARKVQQAIMPSKWPAVDHWEFAGHHTTSRMVGGDYYDAILAADGRVWCIVADACGKGAPAALLAAKIHAGFHALVDRSTSPASLLKELNELLLRREVESLFVTALIGIIDPTAGRAVFASAGHPPPVLCVPNQPMGSLDLTPGFMLGIRSDAIYEDHEWICPVGAGLLMYTDGVTEAINEAGELYGDARLLGLLQMHTASGLSAAQMIERVVQAVNQFCAPAGSSDSDDLTLLACCRRSR